MAEPTLRSVLDRARLRGLLNGASIVFRAQCAALDDRGRVFVRAESSSFRDGLPFDVSPTLFRVGLLAKPLHTKWQRTFADMLDRAKSSGRPQWAEFSGARLRVFQCAAPIVAGNECVGFLVSGKVPLAPVPGLARVSAALEAQARSVSDRKVATALRCVGALPKDRIPVRLRMVGEMAACASRVVVQMLQMLHQREARQARAHVQAFAKVVQAINTGQTENEILKVVVGQGFRLVNADHGTIHVWDPRAEKLIWRANRTPPGVRAKVKVGAASPLEKGVVGWVFRNRKPALIRDLKKERRWRKIYWEGFEGIRSELAVPLACPSGPVGVLNVESCQPNAFTEEHREILQALGDHAVVALQRTEHFRTKSRQLEAFATAASKLGPPYTLEEQLKSIVHQAVRAVGGSVGSIKLYDDRYSGDRKGALHFVAACDADGKDMGQLLGGKPFKVFVPKGSARDSVSAAVFRSRRGRATPDTRLEPVWQHVSWPVRSGIHVPMLVHNHPVGILAVDSPRVDGFTGDDLDVLQRLGNQAAVAVENAWHDELVARVRQILPDMMTISPRETPGEHRAQFLARLAGIVWDVMKPRACTIVVPQENGDGHLIVPKGCEYGIQRRRSLRLWAGQGLGGRAIKTRRIQESRNVQADARFGEKGLAARSGLVSALSVPIVAGKRSIGALNYYAGFKRSFSEFERRALQTICGIAGGVVIATAQAERRRVEGILEATGTGVTLVGVPTDWAERRQRYKEGDPDWNLNLQMRLLYINKRHREYAPQAKVGDVCYKAFNTPRQDRPCWWCPTLRAMLTHRAQTSFTHSPAPPKRRVEHFQVTASILMEAKRPIAAIESTLLVTRELEGAHFSTRLVDLADEEDAFRLGAECLGRGCHADRVAYAELLDGRTLAIRRIYTVNARAEARERRAYSPWTPKTPRALPPVYRYFEEREHLKQWLFTKRSRHPDVGKELCSDASEAILATIKGRRGVAVLDGTAMPDSVRALALFGNVQKAQLVRLGAKEKLWGCVILVHEKPPSEVPAPRPAADGVERVSELRWSAEVSNELANRIESLRLGRALEEVAAFRKTIIDEAPVGVLRTDRRGIVTSANRAWQEMASQDPTGRSVFEFGGVRAAGIVGKLRAALRGQEFELHKTRFRFESGKEMVVSARCVPLKEKRRVTGLLVSCWDMSAIETEYSRLVKNLELIALGRLAAGAVHEIMSPARAVDYASQRMGRTLPKLMAAERSVLATTVSEKARILLRGAASGVLPWLARDGPPLPLAQDAEIEKTHATLVRYGVRCNRLDAGVLTRTGLSVHMHKLLAACGTRIARQHIVAYLVSLASIAEATNSIRHSILRIRRLARALRSHAFVESGRRRQEDLHQTIDAALLILIGQLGQLDTDVKKYYTPRVIKLKCVPGQLTQMWRNLLENSLKAIRKSGHRGQISITTRARGGAAVVTVSDNGSGIPLDVGLGALGTAMPEVARGQTTRYGLWIVRQTVEKHGGRLRLRRLQKGGTSVTVTLPMWKKGS
ncbi:MAG: GAF domain-containing protein [Phycisphaerae bacterium]|nr:GAF domain-containing protein [Phycisphaerae bacterium]